MTQLILTVIAILGVSITLPLLADHLRMKFEDIVPPKRFVNRFTGDVLLTVGAMFIILLIILMFTFDWSIVIAWFWPFVKKKHPNDKKVFGEFSRNDVWKACIQECLNIYIKSTKEEKARLREKRNEIDFDAEYCIYAILRDEYWLDKDFRMSCGKMFTGYTFLYDPKRPRFTHLEFAIDRAMGLTRLELDYLIDVILTGRVDREFNLSYGGKWYLDKV